MAVHECETRSTRRRFRHSALQVDWFEAGISVDIAIPVTRKNEPLNQRGLPRLSTALPPQSKTHIFLAVGAK
jgi:hypothetical protein